MSFTLAEIFINNSLTEHNRDLTNFLDRNMHAAITKGRIRFRFKIARISDHTQLKEMGIKKLPAMIIGEQYFMGVPIIVNELQKRVRNSKAPAAVKTNEEIVDEYFKKEIGNPISEGKGKINVNDMEQETTEGFDPGAAVHREMERRKHADGGPKTNTERMQDMRRPPPKASHEHERDDDYENRDRRPPPGRQQPRKDNLSMAGDPIAILDQMQRNSPKDKDDDLVRMMLDKSGE